VTTGPQPDQPTPPAVPSPTPPTSPARASGDPLPAAPSAQPYAASADPATQPARDLRCLVCGYNLYSLEPSAACPECGSPVSRSMRGAFLRSSSPEYVRTLRLGIVLAELAVVLYALFDLVPGAWRVVTALTLWTTEFPLDDRTTSVLTASATLLGLVGWFVLTTPDPVIGAIDPARKARQLTRACVVVQLFGAAAKLMIAFTPAGGGIVQVGLLNSLVAIGQAAWVVQFFAALRLIELIALRAETPKLAMDAKRSMWLIPLVGIGGACVAIGPLVALVLYIWLLDQTRRVISRAARQAALPHDGSSLPS
jgi:hypothetical protein